MPNGSPAENKEIQVFFSMDLKLDLKNPYPHTPKSIASEILQLLLVVERIKADKDSYQRLRSLAKIKQGFEDSPGVGLIKNTRLFHSGTDNLALSTLCSVLDEGLGATSFSSKSIRFAEYNQTHRYNQDPTTVPKAPEQHHWSKVWTEDIPAVIDSQHFRFENLNQWRLHYPHLQVLLAYKHGRELLLEVSKLLALDYAKFVESAQEWATQEFSYILNDNKQNLSNLPPMLAQHVEWRATEQFLNELNRITQRAKQYLDWSFDEGYYFTPPKVEKQEKNWEDWQVRDLGKQPVLSVDLLQADIERAIKEGDLELIAESIANSLANKIHPNKFDKDFTHSYEYRQSLIGIYEKYATGRTQLLWHTEDELQLNYNTLLRGIGFSIWREKHQTKERGKTAVLKDAGTFLGDSDEKGHPYCIGKPSTIKQSYEEIKGYAKRSRSKVEPSRLVRLIRSQMTTRLPFYTPKVRYVFAPFNIDYEMKVSDVASRLGSLLDFEINQLSYQDICELFRSLSSKDIFMLEKDDLVEVLRKRGVTPRGRHSIRLDRNSLSEVLRKDIWVGD